MSAIAQELDDIIMDLIRDALREHCDDSEIILASVTVDIIRNLNENGYLIVKEAVYNGDI